MTHSPARHRAPTWRQIRSSLLFFYFFTHAHLSPLCFRAGQGISITERYAVTIWWCGRERPGRGSVFRRQIIVVAQEGEKKAYRPGVSHWRRAGNGIQNTARGLAPASICTAKSATVAPGGHPRTCQLYIEIRTVVSKKKWKRKKPPTGQPSFRLPVASLRKNVKFVCFSRDDRGPALAGRHVRALWMTSLHCAPSASSEADPGRAEHETFGKARNP
ncbi:hypothetical protein EDB84DRAFT_75623 [Lactarius hengduanensis]|nr:hypothetical protein EDB84DRAFT_75623 [Lactarius hengduanensis]